MNTDMRSPTQPTVAQSACNVGLTRSQSRTSGAASGAGISPRTNCFTRVWPPLLPLRLDLAEQNRRRNPIRRRRLFHTRLFTILLIGRLSTVHRANSPRAPCNPLKIWAVCVPIYLVIPGSGNAIITMATPLDPSEEDWSQASDIVLPNRGRKTWWRETSLSCPAMFGRERKVWRR